MEEGNPFIYNSPLDPDDLINREQETKLLVDLARGGHNTRLTAPRRYGKTSVLRKVGAQAAKLDLIPIYVDFYGVTTLENVVVRLEEAYTERLTGKVRRTAVNLIRALKPRASLGIPGIANAEITPTFESENSRLLLRLLDLPVDLYERKNRKVLVIFDEFQAILGASNQIDALFRSRIQHHTKKASYIFAGSHPGMMAELFSARERPFYGQARAIVLNPLAEDDCATYIDERFTATDRDIGKMLDPLIDLTQGHPQRTMLLAHHLWSNTPPNQISNADHWAQAVDDVFGQLSEPFMIAWDRFNDNERRVLKALAYNQPLTAKNTLAQYGLNKPTALETRKRLERNGDLQRNDSVYNFVDPLFKQWLISEQSKFGFSTEE